MRLLPFENQFDGQGPAPLLRRLAAERGQYGDGPLAPLLQPEPPLGLIVLASPDKDTKALERTLTVWAGQSCPQAPHLVAASVRQGLAALPPCRWVTFARPGDVLHPGLATRIGISERTDGADLLVWFSGLLSATPLAAEPAARLLNFRRRPQLERLTLARIPYIGLDFACRRSLLEAFPGDLDDSHALQVWLAGRPDLRWLTLPETLALRGAEPPPPSRPRPAPSRPADGITVVIPFRDHAGLTQDCLDSVLAQRCRRPPQIVLVNNQSTAQSMASIDAWLTAHADADVTIVNYDRPFNHSAQSNLGAARGRGEAIVFLNNDARLLDADLLEDLAGWAVEPGIASVAPRIVEADGTTLACAGLRVLPRLGPATAPFVEESRDPSFAADQHEVFGNSFSCAAVSRAVLAAIGGLDEVAFPNGYNDVEFALRARAKGYTHLYCGSLRASHQRGASRQTTDETPQRALLRRRYAAELAGHALFQLTSLSGEELAVASGMNPGAAARQILKDRLSGLPLLGPLLRRPEVWSAARRVRHWLGAVA